MSGRIRLVVNTQTQQLVASEIMPTPVGLPAMIRQDQIPMDIVFVEPNPTGGLVSPLQLVDVTELSIRVGMGPRSGVLSGNAPVLQLDWEKDVERAAFSSVLNLRTNQFEALFMPDNLDQLLTWFEIVIVRGGQPKVVLQLQVRVSGNVIRSGTLSPEDAQNVDLIVDALAMALHGTNSIYWEQNGQGAAENIIKPFEHPFTFDEPLPLGRNKITSILAEVIWPPAGTVITLTGVIATPYNLINDRHYALNGEWSGGQLFRLGAASNGARVTISMLDNQEQGLPAFTVEDTTGSGNSWNITAPDDHTELSFLFTGGEWTLQERVLTEGPDFTHDADLGMVEFVPTGIVDDLEADSTVRFVFGCQTAAQIKGHVRVKEGGGVIVTPQGLALELPPLSVCDGAVHSVTPIMTSGSQGGYIITSNSQAVGNEAWRAFDGNDAAIGWQSLLRDTTMGELETYLQLQLPAPRMLVGFIVRHPSEISVDGISWKFQGSTDGVTFTDLKVVAAGTTVFNQPFLVLTPGEYTYYRMVFGYAPDRGTYTSFVHELILFEQLPSVVLSLDGDNELCAKLILDPSGGLEIGPRGLRLKAVDDLGTIPGGIIRSPTMPPALLFPDLRRHDWKNTSVSPHPTNVWDDQLGKYIEQPLPYEAGHVGTIVSTTPPNVAANPKWAFFTWHNPTTITDYRWVGSPTTGEWIDKCTLCGTGGGGGQYLGKLPNVTFYPVSGTVIPTGDITLSVPGHVDAVIFYTIDGTTPAVDESGAPTGTTAEYDPEDKPEFVAAGTIKAFATKTKWFDSDIATAEYVVENDDEWLASFDYVGPETPGRAATFDDEFTDRWNVLALPAIPAPEYPVFFDADGDPLPDIKLRYSTWTQGPNPPLPATATLVDTGHTHPGYRYGMQINDTGNRAWEIFITLPLGVYDIYVAGHGPNNSSGIKVVSWDRQGVSAEETTANSGTTWKTTAWVEGQQYVLFADVEPGNSLWPGSSPNGEVAIRFQGVNGLAASIRGFLSLLQVRKKKKMPKVRFQPVPGSQFSTTQNVVLSVPGYASATIRYTTDGSPPNGSSTVYSAPINLAATTTVKAIAILAGFTTSEINLATFTKI